MCASVWCKFPSSVYWSWNPWKGSEDLFIATKSTLYFCVIIGGWFVGFLDWTEDDESRLAVGPMLGAVCGWYKDWDGFAVALRLVFVWKGLLLAHVKD